MPLMNPYQPSDWRQVPRLRSGWDWNVAEIRVLKGFSFLGLNDEEDDILRL